MMDDFIFDESRDDFYGEEKKGDLIFTYRMRFPYDDRFDECERDERIDDWR